MQRERFANQVRVLCFYPVQYAVRKAFPWDVLDRDAFQIFLHHTKLADFRKILEYPREGMYDQPFPRRRFDDVGLPPGASFACRSCSG